MPPMTVMKIMFTVQSLMLKAENGVMLSFCRKIMEPTMAVAAPVTTEDDHPRAVHIDAVRLGRRFVAVGLKGEPVAGPQQQDDDPDHRDGEGEEHPIDR